MFAPLLVKNSWLVALVAATLVAGSALADRDGHGGGGGNRGGGGGGGGGRSYSGQSRGGGGGGGRSFSGQSRGGGGGGGASTRSFQGGGGGSHSAPSMRSSGSGNSNRSAWSGGGSSNRSRSMNNPAFSSGGDSRRSPRTFSAPNGSNNPPRRSDFDRGSDFARNMRQGVSNQSNQSNRFREFSQSNRTSESTTGQSNDATRQFRAYRGAADNASQSAQFRGRPSSDSESRNLYRSGNNPSRQSANNEQLQEMFRQNRQRQAANSSNNLATGDDATRRQWNTRSSGDGRPNDGNKPGGTNLGNFSGRATGNQPGDGKADRFGSGDSNRFGDRGSSNQFRNRPSDGERNRDGNFARHPADNRGDWNRDQANYRAGNRHGSGYRGEWSKNDGDRSNPKTERWYGRSGYGDHRGRGDHYDGDRGNWGNHVRNDWNRNYWNKGGHGYDWYRNRGWRDLPFAYAWWGGQRNLGYHWYWGNRGWRSDPWYWWGYTSAPVLTSWIDFGWNYPCYWDYGPDEYITYYNNMVYLDSQPYTTALDYYAQVRNLARSVPALSQDELAGIEWLPLGVFAITRPGQDQANELVQLAVSKDGILSGTLFNQQTGQARPLAGMVEHATQKAAWAFADSPTDALVVETSLYNLTEPELTALAHLDAVNTEVWQLVRLKQPQPPATAPAGAVGAPAPAAQPLLPPQGAVQ